jgi:glycosyltransferase involved in cell wall biosynthesis
MTSHNSEKTISEAIESILNQTFKEIELIIINDKSTDKTLNIIRKYSQKDKRIKIINNHKNIGQTKSRNLALKISKGKYIAIMDSDDISINTRLETQYNFLEKNKEIFLCGTDAYTIDENGKTTGTYRGPVKSREIEKKLPRTNCFLHPTIMFRNDKKTYYREKIKYAEDYDLILTLLSRGAKMCNLPKILVKYRRLKTSIGISKTAIEAAFANKAREFYLERRLTQKDSYNTFNPRKIMLIKTDKVKDKFILKCLIEASFKINNFKETRRFCKKYFHTYGILNKFSIYFLASFLGERSINIMRKIIFK